MKKVLSVLSILSAALFVIQLPKEMAIIHPEYAGTDVLPVTNHLSDPQGVR